ncbi:hypothetical protein SAMN05880574_1154 [Chryseobacterium sp. RU37D]|nr:hypothetical protein SAMN05880574_1154 [Chryseobacterium sp. RU37D]
MKIADNYILPMETKNWKTISAKGISIFFENDGVNFKSFEIK